MPKQRKDRMNCIVNHHLPDGIDPEFRIKATWTPLLPGVTAAELYKAEELLLKHVAKLYGIIYEDIAGEKVKWTKRELVYDHG